MYIKKIIIENFQSHEHTEIELPPGLTIIVGESDRGKSAIIRALRWVFENEPSGTDFIRAGTRNCRVTVETDQGITVSRERTPSRNRYMVKAADGVEETYEGFRNEIPEEVVAAHGVTKARLDSDLEVSLNIAPQLDGPFLLSSPGSVKAKAIGRLYKVHLIDAAIRDTSQDINKLTREEAHIDSRLSELEQNLEEFADLPSIEDRLNKANALMEKINQLTKRKNNLTQIQSRWVEIHNEIAYLKNISEKLSALNTGVGLYDTVGQLVNKKQNLTGISTWLKSTRDKLHSAQEILAATTGIEEGYPQYDCLINIFNQRIDLVSLKIKLNKINRDRQIQSAAVQSTDRVPDSIKQMQLLTDIINVCGHLDNAWVKLNTLRKQQKNYRLLAEQTERIEIAAVQCELIGRLEQKYTNLVNRQKILAGLKQAMAGENIVSTKTEQLATGLEKYDLLVKLPQKLGELHKFAGQYKKLSERIRKGHEYLEEREQEILSSAQNYSSVLKKLGHCPTCFGKVDEVTMERIVAELKWNAL